MFPSLHAFLDALDAAGELRRISEPVDPRLEVAAIVDRHSKRLAPTTSPTARAVDPAHAALGGEALLFENVSGCDFPLAVNVFGSWRRMEMALGCVDGGFERIAGRIASLTKPEPPRNMGELMARGREFLPLLRIPPRTVRASKAPCQEIVRRTEAGEVDLTRLPIIKCWPLDGDPAAVGYPITAEESGTAGGEGRYITLAGMHTIHARDRGVAKPSSHNIGMYRSQLLDSTHLAMHWHVHHDGASHWRSWKAIGERMPIAIALGGESVMPYAATCPLPPGIGELLMAGFLHGRGIPLVAAKTVPLRVPANAEIVIEGWVSTECGPIGWDPRGDEPLGPGAVFEGPFGDHTGFYSLPDRYPILEVTAVTHRREAIYPTTIVGLPPQEDYYIGKATERIMLPLLRTIIHDIEDYHLPMFGTFHNCAFVRINKAYPLQARRVMNAIWGAGQMAWTKMIVVVDDDVDVHDEAAVMRALAERCHLRRDIQTVRGPLDILDHAAPRLGAGTKIGFDATRFWPGEEAEGVGGETDGEGEGAIRMPTSCAAIATALRTATDDEGVRGVSVPTIGGGRFVAVATDAADRAAVERTLAGVRARLDAGGDELAGAGELLIAVGPDVDLDDWEAIFFHFTANADPGRDAIRTSEVAGTSGLAFDATSKQPHPAVGDAAEPVRDYPPILVMDADVERRIDERAGALGLAD